ncbi:sensor histidine kinase [Streptomyces sp. H39-S7]|uniref:sensor histidine kinase n=1 Tax=Streptomyces sp. H39-S7 TaxID=3004357 RepID=UPI0022AFA034|nr:ATP-binding protein [Streptomyces sp. H39-S7]MCZ4119933.1 ATP-binding protein [Streptomyces sp. H39-S7]
MIVDEVAWHPLTLPLATEQDVFALRRQAQALGAAIGLDRQDQVRLATALSELGRDRFPCGAATVTFTARTGASPAVLVTLHWTSGPEPSRDSLDLASRLLPHIAHTPGSHRIEVEQPLPGTAPADWSGRLRDALRADARTTVAEDLRAQTRDLIASLEETRAQREELQRLNEELEETNRGVLALYTELSQELEETNRGVVALYAELEDKSQQLSDASEAKSRFWANVSHELRTPVNAVVGLTRLLLSETSALTDDQRRQLSLIGSSGDTLLSLVGELLDVAKAESGQLQIQPAPVDLRVLLGQLHGTLRGTAAPDVTLTIADPAPAPRIATDEILLTRVLRNLLSNALKFTDHGEVRLDLRAEVRDEQRWLVFTVTDTGIGIAADQHVRVFEEFYQVPGPHQRGRPGTGLGLPYARRLTDLLGGVLTLDSVPGRGTTVEVRMPELIGRPAAAQAPHPTSEQHHAQGNDR